jgi:hypothetical protein
MPLFAGLDEIVVPAIFEVEVTAALTRRGLAVPVVLAAEPGLAARVGRLPDAPEAPWGLLVSGWAACGTVDAIVGARC